MLKINVMKGIRKAKLAHVCWVSYALAVIEGVSKDVEKAPFSSDEGAFADWLYGEGYALAYILSPVDLFTEMEALNTEIHEIYMAMFTIKYVNQAPKKIFFKDNAYEIQELVENMKNKSKHLIDKIKQLENFVCQLSNKELMNLLKVA